MDPEQRFVEAMSGLGCLGGTWLVALSGGSDSVALLRLCAATTGMTGNTYEAARVRHDVRDGGTEDNEISFCAGLCEDAGIGFTSLSEEGEKPGDIADRLGCGPEEAARRYRYRLLRHHRAQIGAKGLLLAHTLDDNRETLLMRVLSGVGPEGLKGIPAAGDGLRRPLLGFGGAELRTYLSDRGIRWCEDSTNRDNQYLRNRVRNRLIPVLRDVIPAWESAVDTLIDRSGEAADALEHYRRQQLNPELSVGEVSWTRNAWQHAPEYIKARALFNGINHLRNKDDDSRIPWTVVKELRRGANLGRDSEAAGYRLRSETDRILLSKVEAEWKGRMYLEGPEALPESVDTGGGIIFVTDKKNEIVSPAVEIPIPGYPMELIWHNRQDRIELTMRSPGLPEYTEGRTLAIGHSSLTEKLSGSVITDADKYIVYIQVSDPRERRK